MRTLWLSVVLLAAGCGPRLARPLVPRDAAVPVWDSSEWADLVDVDALWDFHDPSETRSAFQRRRVELESRIAAGDLDAEGRTQLELARLELLTQLARTHTLEGELDLADVLLARVREELGARPDSDAPRVRVRERLEHGRARLAEDAVSEARAAFVQAWDLGRRSSPQLDGLAVDAAHMVSIADTGTPGELEWGHRAFELSEASANADAQKWKATLLNNLGWGYFERNSFDRALDLMNQQVGLREATGEEPALRVARWSVARVLRALGRFEEALAAQQDLIERYGDEALADGFVHEEMAECLLALERPDEARPWFASAHGLMAETWLADGEPERLARLAQLGGVVSP